MAIAQEGWKRLLGSVEEWEELMVEEETQEQPKEVEGTEGEQVEWTREGFLEVGEIMETILEEVNAFSELREITCGTVQANKEATANPPDRAGEIETIKQEIERIEEQIEASKPPVPIGRLNPPETSEGWNRK